MARCVAPQTIQHDKQCGTMHWPVASLIHLLLQQLFHCFSPVFLFLFSRSLHLRLPVKNSGAHWATHAINVLAQHYYYRYLCCPYT